MSVSSTEVLYLARLARLRLDEAEVTEMSAQLGAILGHIDQLRSVVLPDRPPDEESVPPDALRPDHPDADDLMRAPGAHAPAWVDPFFTVPRIAALDADGVSETS